MTRNPFLNPAFAAVGEQMLQMWQKAIDSWWSQLLGDSSRLAELGQRLSSLGLGGQTSARELSAELSRVVEALELMDERVSTLEAQVRELAESAAVLLSVMGADRTDGSSSQQKKPPRDGQAEIGGERTP